jgi:hypothetical protein
MYYRYGKRYTDKGWGIYDFDNKKYVRYFGTNETACQRTLDQMNNINHYNRRRGVIHSYD